MPADVLSETDTEASIDDTVARAADALLGALGRADDELTVVLVDDARVRTLNRDFRGKDTATDVLSFPQLEGGDDDSDPRPADAPPALLGDIVVSVDTARRQAASGGWSLEEEIVRLTVHGLLHLLGFDHERSAAEAAAMRTEEHRLADHVRAAGLPCAPDPLTASPDEVAPEETHTSEETTS